MTGSSDEKFLGEENEWLVVYTKDKLKEEHFDYFVFGHRHLPIDFQLSEHSRYINLGDWIKYNSYAEFDGNQVQLKYYQ
jgi:UDP-2,3-diacylglucosamine hydrolase